MDEIIQELSDTIKWIPLRERCTKTYLDYLDKVNIDLKAELAKEVELEIKK